MANLQISKLDNYIHILDMDKDVLYSEHSFRVLVRKLTHNGDKYDIAFLRSDSTPATFYSATISQIYDAVGTPFTQGDWETWYQNNTGDINAASIVSQLNSQVKTPVIERISGTALTITVAVRSISIACPNTSGSPIDVTTNGSTSFVQLFPGETVHYDAGTLNNYFAANLFYIDTTAGGEALITYII